MIAIWEITWFLRIENISIFHQNWITHTHMPTFYWRGKLFLKQSMKNPWYTSGWVLVSLHDDVLAPGWTRRNGNTTTVKELIAKGHAIETPHWKKTSLYIHIYLHINGLLLVLVLVLMLVLVLVLKSVIEYAAIRYSRNRHSPG